MAKCACGCGNPASPGREYAWGHKTKAGVKTSAKKAARQPDGGATPVPEADGANVTLAVPTSAIDSWWQGLSAHRRGQIFVAELGKSTN